MTREITSTKKQDWATPQWLFDILNAEYGYTHDLFAAWYNKKLPNYFGPGSPLGEDAFEATVENIRAFVNPEYSNIEKAMELAFRNLQRGWFSTFLVPANTDTKWFHRYAKLGQVDLFEGRISFDDVTPLDLEMKRLLAVAHEQIEKNRAKGTLFKTLTKLAEVYNTAKANPELQDVANSDIALKVESFLDLNTAGKWRLVKPKLKKPGPGFPSMLVHFDPASVAGPHAFRTRSAKTGSLL